MYQEAWKIKERTLDNSCGKLASPVSTGIATENMRILEPLWLPHLSMGIQ